MTSSPVIDNLRVLFKDVEVVAGGVVVVIFGVVVVLGVGVVETEFPLRNALTPCPTIPSGVRPLAFWKRMT